jgi:hypothetical protein
MANKSSSNQISALLEQSLAGISGTRVQSPTGSSGGSDSGASQTSAMTEQLQSLTQQLQQLQTVNQTQITAMQQNTQAVTQSASSKAQGSSGSVGGSIGSTLLNFLGLGSGLSPLISGLTSLFGGGGSSPQPLIPYVAPLPVQATAGINASGASGAVGVNNGTVGLPQPVPASTPAASPQITVQVQAMDSQSFLDHSNDIAMAVRQAMLESSVLNDVIRGV